MSLTLTLLTAVSLSFAAQDHDHDGGHAHDHPAEHQHDMATTPVDTVPGRTITVAVNGMVCDFCARSLTKVLERNDAVEAVDVSLESKNITILLTETGTMSDDELNEAVRNAGYNIASIERPAS
ncbi:MAG: heavy-metal-associated domain-containing protein [Pseudomonadota bacterium]